LSASKIDGLQVGSLLQRPANSFSQNGEGYTVFTGDKRVCEIAITEGLESMLTT